MNNRHEITITARDRVFLAWEDSMELVRDFESYSQEIKDDDALVKMFKDFAKDEGVHAAKFLELLHTYETK